MLLLSGANLKKTFTGETLFENVTFNVYSTDKIGFVGVNGAGKSTLFKMIADQMDYDSGDIFKGKDTKIGYLEQHAISDGTLTIMEEMLKAFSEVISIEAQLAKVRQDIEEQSEDMQVLISRQASLQERFMALDGMYYRSKIKSVLTGLGFSEEDLSKPVGQLSGGQKTRVALGKILLSDTNLLLLDEPTNYLDIDSVEWLEGFLSGYKGAFIVISHDRFFLDKITNKTFEIENTHFRSYDGNYSAYMAQREIDRLTEQRNYDYATREIHRLEEVVEQQRRWKHKKNKKTHTLDNTRKKIERLEENLVEPEKSPMSMRFRFKACAGGAQKVLTTQDLGMAFEGRQLFQNVDMLIKKGEKVFLLGPNGCGKTTLIKILMGMHQPTSGEYRIGENIHVGYYDQLKENLNREKMVIDEVWDEYRTLEQTDIRNALAVFLFRGEDVYKEIRSLSGGELARVELTKLLLKQVNFLIMDEPTNHLDIHSREALETALSDYDGTMLMVSHDRYFINKLADRILYLTPDGVVEYIGNYEAYLANRQVEANEKQPEAPAEEKGRDYKERKRLEAEKRKTLNRFAKVEALIEETENQIAQLSQESENPDIASDYVKLTELSTQIDSLRHTLDGYMDEWEELQMTIDAMGYEAGNTEHFS